MARIEPVRTEVRVPAGTGPVPLAVTVTHAGDGSVWPAAPGHPAFGLVAGATTGPVTPAVLLPETDPGAAVRRQVDLRSLADALGPGRHEVEIQVRLPDGRPLASVRGPVVVTLVVG